MRHWKPISALFLVTLLGVTVAAAAEPVSLGDVIILLEAEVGEPVIRRQVARLGAGFDLGTEEILRLRDAGASGELISFLQDNLNLAALPDSESTAAGAAPAPTGASLVRVFRTTTETGVEALVLTNLDDHGRRLGGEQPNPAPMRGVISASERPGYQMSPPATDTSSLPAPLHSGLPSQVEIVVRNDDDTTERLLEEVVDRLDQLEEVPGRPPVGAGMPEHPINDHNDYVIASPWGFYTYPLFAQPEEFRVVNSGPYMSFTGARFAGFDPYKPVNPCRPGVACSVSDRAATQQIRTNRARHPGTAPAQRPAGPGRRR